MSRVIIHEGYLFKTPPLDKFFMSWKKRWFVLSLKNAHDASSLDLCYYKDATKQGKVESIDIHKIKSINPVYNKSKENVFSLEMLDCKFVLRAADRQDKAVWVAKLLECCSKDGSSLHVTVPTQPAASFAEGVLKTSTPLKVTVISSFNGDEVMVIPFDRIRRFGCQLAVDKDILWFETCGCKGHEEQFQFMIVALGIERAYQIVQEYKRSIELALRDHLILEEGDQSQFLYSYVVKSHYGHTDYPVVQRERILQSSIMSLSTSGGALSLSELNKFTRSRPSFPSTSPNGSTERGASPYSSGRGASPYSSRHSASPYSGSGGRGISPASGGLSPTSGGRSPTSPSSPTQDRIKPRITLTQLQKSPRPMRSSLPCSPPADFDSGVSMSGPDDPSRNSAPCYADGSMPRPRMPLSTMGLHKSFDSGLGPGHRPTLQDVRENGKEVKRLNMSLGQLQLQGGIQAFNKQQRDSGLGGSGGYEPYSKAGAYSKAAGYSKAGAGYVMAGSQRGPYDHLPDKNRGYDHLGKVTVTPATPPSYKSYIATPPS